jgi:glutamine cyclotransferase
MVTRKWFGLLSLVLFLSVLLVMTSCTAASAPMSMQAATRSGSPTPLAQATFVPRRGTPQPPVATSVAQPTPTPTAIPTYGYRVINTYPHDSAAFTQGLVYSDGQFYEGTGLEGRSSLRRVELATGRVLQKIDLGAQYFGEGIALLNDKIYQLTWRNGVGFIYDKASFARIGSWNYPAPGRSLPVEGWGLTTDGQQLIMSDGTANLYFLDPQTLAVTREVTVGDTNGTITWLNELEYIDGAVFANIWQTDTLVKIDPQTGQVLAYVDLGNLLSPAERQNTDVLNGIAYDPVGKRLFVTGKFWPKLFEIQLILPSTSDHRVNMPYVVSLSQLVNSRQ